MSSKFHVAILGVTGAVGEELLKKLSERNFPVASLKLLASSRSTSKSYRYDGVDVQVEATNSESFRNTDIAFLSAGAARSREYAPDVIANGGLVIDNSSAFRLNSDVPLVVPEINFGDISPETRLVANPNCTAAIMLMAVSPLRSLGTIKRLVISTYQSASGAGAQAMDELWSQSADVLAGKPAEPKVLPHPYAFNLFSHNTPINEAGYNDEEWKVIAESRKMLSMPDLAIGVTCVRVPVLRAHSISVTVEFEGREPAIEAVREVLTKSPGVRVVDDRAGNHFPMPLEASGEDDVFVGRIRKDVSHPSAISMFISGDQLLKGAALNAIQIAERMIEAGYI